MSEKITEILEDLFFIERGYLNGNHFVYRSEQPVLIDTGYRADLDETLRLIRTLGADVSKTRLIINTHSHCDHIGANQCIQELSGCDIALHKVGKNFIDTRNDWATWWKYYGQEADFFDCTSELEDGRTVWLGPHRFRVIYTPGHASDGIVLYNEEERLLLSSDTLWERDVAVMTVRVEGSRAPFCMLESLSELRGLDVEMVYPGHGEPFRDFDQALDSAERKVGAYVRNASDAANDLLKKIIVYTLLMRRHVEESDFFSILMDRIWFRETVDLYFQSEYRKKYQEIMEGFFRRGIVVREGEGIRTTVKP